MLTGSEKAVLFLLSLDEEVARPIVGELSQEELKKLRAIKFGREWRVAHRDLMIAGHTDNVPIKTSRYKNNWELSTQRAVVVVGYMIEKGFPADHLAAAGYGEMDPIADNGTEEGKAKNRRIEIQLMPDLGELRGIEEMVNEGKGKK